MQLGGDRFLGCMFIALGRTFIASYILSLKNLLCSYDETPDSEKETLNFIQLHKICMGSPCPTIISTPHIR